MARRLVRAVVAGAALVTACAQTSLKVFPQQIEAQYAKAKHTASEPFGTVELEDNVAVITRSIIMVNPYDELVEVNIRVETDAEIEWLRLPVAEQGSVKLEPAQEFTLEVEIDPHIMPTAEYTATIFLEIAWELYTAYSWSYERVMIPVTFYLEAPPDALTSRVNFDNCTGLTYTQRCVGSVKLVDIDGFAATTGKYTSAVQAFGGASKKDYEELAVRETNTGVLEVEFVASAVGKLEAKVLVFNVPIKSDAVFDVTCGPNMSPDETDPTTCVCNAGYEHDESTEEAVCTRCKACNPGEYAAPSTQSSSCSCSTCPKGSYCPDQETVLPCPAGHYCPERAIEATPCPEDTFQESTGQSACLSCSKVDASAGTFGKMGAASQEACAVCPDGAYCDPALEYGNGTRDGDNLTCTTDLMYTTAAEAGTMNASVQFVAFAAPGFFRFPPLKEAGDGDPASPCASVDFYTCPDGSERCVGESNASALTLGCAEGYDGFLCLGCAEGYSKVGDRCFTCERVMPYLFAAVAGAVACSMVAFISWRIILRSERRAARRSLLSGEADRVTSEAVVTVLKIAYSHLQVLSLLLTIDVDWHKSVSAVEKMASTITISNSEVTSSVMCLFDESGDDGARVPGFYAKVSLVYAFPVICALLFACVWAVLWATNRCRFGDRVQYAQGLQLSVMVLLFLTHIILLRTALELFVCSSEVQDRSFLVADPRIECFAGPHVAWFVVAGFGGLMLYGCGIPALSALLVVKGSNPYLHTFLCKNFSRDREYWESIVALRKVAMTIFIITLAKFGPIAQGVSCLMCLFSALLLQAQVEPYTYPFLNQLETAGLVTVLFTLSMALYSLSFGASVDFGLNVMIAIVNFAFALLVVFELLAATVLSKLLFSRAGRLRDDDPHAPREVGRGGRPPLAVRFSSRYVASRQSHAFSRRARRLSDLKRDSELPATKQRLSASSSSLAPSLEAHREAPVSVTIDAYDADDDADDDRSETGNARAAFVQVA